MADGPALRERIARQISSAWGDDPDCVVVRGAAVQVNGGFTIVPKYGAPLWTFYLEAAEAVIELLEQDASEAMARRQRRQDAIDQHTTG